MRGRRGRDRRERGRGPPPGRARPGPGHRSLPYGRRVDPVPAPRPGGVLRRVDVPDLPGTHSEVHLRPGDEIPDPVDSACRVGHVVARAATADEARGLAGRAAARSRVEVG
ncbi:hypothetical protein [Streptomyces sp. NPDC046988]|uniref:hypothetical protein n=1 Tax=Streptomyces sp. NPDC046988 TaxID=3154922 RepID=UPI0033CD4E7E